MAYLRLVVNPSDNISLKRIINIPKRGIGDATVEKLEAALSVSVCGGDNGEVIAD